MGANTTTISGRTVDIALHATHNTDWVWTDETASPTGDTSAKACIASIQINPAAANCDIVIRDGSATGPRLMVANMTDTDDNRVKYFKPPRWCKPFIDTDDCTNSGSATIQMELA
jgi:hypothetical protein